MRKTPTSALIRIRWAFRLVSQGTRSATVIRVLDGFDWRRSTVEAHQAFNLCENVSTSMHSYILLVNGGTTTNGQLKTPIKNEGLNFIRQCSKATRIFRRV